MDISPIEESLQKMAKAILEEFAGADAVTFTLMEHETITTVYQTDPDAKDVDGIQYSNGTGPCVDAMRGNMIVRTAPLEEEERWPEYASEAKSRGFTAVIAAPLTLAGVSIGALNLYSRSVREFDQAAEAPAQAYGTQASFAVEYAKLYEQSQVTVDQLEEALKSRAVIDQAMGILMERERINSQEAFDMLKTASQHGNVKLRDIARRLVEGRGGL